MLRWILAAMLAFAAGSAQAAATPAHVVDAFQASLLDAMQNGPALGCAGRTKLMSASIDASFDLPFIARQIMKRHWTELSDAQQRQFTAALRRLVIATYASQFARHNGESFSTQDTQALPRGAQLVHARLSRKDGDPVSFDYVLHDAAGWRIINVVADGVSDLAIRSAQYDQLFRKQGFDGLDHYLDDQTGKMQEACK